MRNYFNPEVDRTTSILRPMNPLLHQGQRGQMFVPADALTPTRNMLGGGSMLNGAGDALAMLSFADAMLRG